MECMSKRIDVRPTRFFKSLDHCSMPINGDQYRSKYRSKSRHSSEIPINADHWRSMPINSSQHWEELTKYDRHWSTWRSITHFWSVLITIGQWSRESCYKPSHPDLPYWPRQRICCYVYPAVPASQRSSLNRTDLQLTRDNIKRDSLIWYAHCIIMAFPVVFCARPCCTHGRILVRRIWWTIHYPGITASITHFEILQG